MDLLSNLDEKSWQNIEPDKIQGTAIEIQRNVT